MLSHTGEKGFNVGFVLFDSLELEDPSAHLIRPSPSLNFFSTAGYLYLTNYIITLTCFFVHLKTLALCTKRHVFYFLIKFFESNVFIVPSTNTEE